MISYRQIILVIIVLFIIIVASNQKYYNTITQLYKNLSKIPKLIIIVVTIFSLLGLSNLIDLEPINFKKPKKNPMILLKEDDNKRHVSEATKKLVAAKQQWTCGLCKRMLDETYEVDHIVPLYKGGTNNISNLMALDPICHRKKTNADRLNMMTSVFL